MWEYPDDPVCDLFNDAPRGARWGKKDPWTCVSSSCGVHGSLLGAGVEDERTNGAHCSPDDNQGPSRTLGFLQGGLHPNLHRKVLLASVNPFSLRPAAAAAQLVLCFCVSVFKSPPEHALGSIGTHVTPFTPAHTHEDPVFWRGHILGCGMRI